MESVQKLSRAIQFKTVSHRNYDQFNIEEFKSFYDFLKLSFPLVTKTLNIEKIGDFGLLYRWQGSRPSLKPILLIAHSDVVPAADSESAWTCSPFSGDVRDGYIWGRGSLDMKMGVIGILEGVELLLAEAHTPERTIYLAFGSDEEVGGRYGACRIARYLKKQNIRVEYVLDEGGFIIKDLMTDIRTPVALVAIAEKGQVDLELVLESEGGHSSMPPRHTGVGILCQAICRIEKKPFPPRITPVLRQFLKHLKPHVSLFKRILFSYTRLFQGIIKRFFSRNPETNALIRTTQAVTMVEGSRKENVLPQRSRAVVNIRLLHGDTIDRSILRIKKVINNPGIKVNILNDFDANNPIAASDIESTGYTILTNALKQIFPHVVSVPFLMVGATDSRHYRDLADAVLRFSPVILSRDDLKRIHGTDERISIESFKKYIDFIMQLIKNS